MFNSKTGDAKHGAAQSPFFVELSGKGRDTRFAADSLIIREHDHGDSLFFIKQGFVRVFSSAEDGSQVIINEHGPGEYIGEMAIDKSPRSASVIALTAVVASIVPRETVLNVIRARPEYALELIFELVHRARATTDAIKGLALLSAYKRITRLLESLVGHPGVPAVIDGCPSNAEIGERVAAPEDMVNLVMRDLTEGGYISQGHGELIIRKKLPSNW
jgi:CRP/FNR family transcriptional regulator, cyclic AMP receptor protein